VCNDIAALPALVEHAFHALDLTGHSAETFANIVHDLVGKLHCKLLSSFPGSG
jgi:hypothetical protein